jgi:hypothetical protein
MVTSKKVRNQYNRFQSISEGVGESHQEETTAGPQSFPVAGRGRKDKSEAGEAKPVYPVCFVYLVSLVERNQRVQRNQIYQKDQKDQMNQIPAARREMLDCKT